MGLSSKWVVLWSLWATRLVRQPTAPVLVSNGWLQGSVAPSGTHNAYVGIPYATVKQRFQAPGPEPNWEGIFDAVKENIVCRQAIYIGAKSTVGQDDCLILNVFTPLRNDDINLLPVMVFIHGGGFFQGSPSPNIYGPEYLVPKGVILVTISYRLNIQGYLCLRTKDAPGNAGMKDQVAALKWVQKNIRAFGGDPNNVTIFGESAGAASVSFHVLSPMSKNLFHKAIIQSGSSLSAWAYQFKPVYMASLLAKTMGFYSQDPHELYKYFSEKSNEELVITRVPRKEGNLLISELLYTPCVEDLLDGVEPFLTEPPYIVLSQGTFNKVPLMIGANNLDGLFFASMENDTTIPKITIEKSLPKNLVFTTEKERQSVVDKLKQIYLDSEGISDDYVIKISTMSGEMNFNYPILEEASIIAEKSDKPIYNYLFSYEGWRNIAKMTHTKHKFKKLGAVHADELFYLFSQNIIPSLFETKAIDTVSTLWTNFAKYGDPVPVVNELLPVRWPPVDMTKPLALNISSDLSIIPMWYSDSLKYLREVYSKYRRVER